MTYYPINHAYNFPSSSLISPFLPSISSAFLPLNPFFFPLFCLFSFHPFLLSVCLPCPSFRVFPSSAHVLMLIFPAFHVKHEYLFIFTYEHLFIYNPLPAFRAVSLLYPCIIVSHIIIHSIQYYITLYRYTVIGYHARFEKPITEVGKWVFIFLVVQWVYGFMNNPLSE